MAGGDLFSIFRTLEEHDVRYLTVGGVAVVLHGHPRFTADLDLVLDLSPTNTLAAIAALEVLGYRPRAPVSMNDFAKSEARDAWREEKGLIVFSLWSSEHPGTEVDLFVEEPFSFADAWGRRLDAVLDDGTTVHVLGMDDLRRLKLQAGRPRDLEDVAELDAIARATMGADEHGA